MKPEMLAAEFACFGTYIASMSERGVIFPDLSPNNVGILDDRRLVIHDMDCGEMYQFPGDLHVYATALFSFVGHIPHDLVAAFRFGYVQHGGRFGRLVFDRLRHEFGITPWGERSQIPELDRLEEAGWTAEHIAWMGRRDSLGLPNLEKGAFFLPGLLRPDESSRIGQRCRTTDPECVYHAFECRLIIELARNDPQAFLWAITEIGKLAAELRDRRRAEMWGYTLMLSSKCLREQAFQWPKLALWFPWVVEDQMRAIGANTRPHGLGASMRVTRE